MDRTEEVKKILAKFGFYVEDKVARQICQLFEPQPSEGRLLTDVKIYNARAYAYNQAEGDEADRAFEGVRGIAKAQLAKDLQFEQARVERIFGRIEEKIILVTHYAIFTRDNPNRLKDWQALKEEET